MEQGIRIRTVILLWPLLLAVSSVHAQSAGDIDTLSQWRVNYEGTTGTYYLYDHYKYYISGTVSVDSLEYYALYRSGFRYGDPNYPPYYNHVYAGALREHENKWYAIDNYGEDILLYDFTLSVGDTVKSWAIPTFIGDTITIGAIDTIMVNGEPRKLFILNHSPMWGGAEYIIEGIGAQSGLFEWMTFFEWSSDLLCYAIDYIPLWQNQLYPNECDLDVSLNESSRSIKVSTYPNPFNTSTTIEYELYTISNIQFTVYNVMGEAVHLEEHALMPPGSHKVTWSPGHLPGGLYYAVLKSEDGVSVVKMIKQ